ncbi:glutaconate CoA-transferase, subunit A [Rhizobiaceae bacterium]|nr:glutaconate CoA-transferase, subunit A [Rhizobiaceae bacterium]
MADDTGSLTNRSAALGKLTDSANALQPFLRDGICIGLGGFGLDRKPMALVREIATAPVRGLTLETFAGGLDVEALLASGKVARISACHVGLDHFGLAPLFRTARQSGGVEFEEWSEWTQLAAWRAAAEKAPYAVVPLDPATDLLKVNPHIIPAPTLFGTAPAFAVRAPTIDIAILHAEAVHPDGWALTSGDTYLDPILARAAKRVVVSAERLIDDAELERRHRDVHLIASAVDAVVLAPGGALPGSCLPNHMLDFPAMRRYVEASAAGASSADLSAIALSGLDRAGDES